MPKLRGHGDPARNKSMLSGRNRGKFFRPAIFSTLRPTQRPFGTRKVLQRRAKRSRTQRTEHTRTFRAQATSSL